MGKSITDLSSVTTVGLDLAKHVFQVHGIDASGRVIVAKALRRKDVLSFFAQLPECLVGMEACGSAHHWARELIKLGHDARTMPPAYVKPYVRRQKNDAADAAGICEAVTRPSMRFVGVRTLENQAALGSRRRNGAPPDDHSRLGPGDGLGDGRQRSGHLRFLRPARVCRLSWPDAETKLVRRQGAPGPRLENGQSIFAKIARRGRACGSLSSQAARRRAAIMGEEAHADQALQACRRRARQQNGAHRLHDHARQDNV
jgi:hypothetical protein